MSELNVVSIILARGGSKGIPRKNIIPLAGKPLIAWSIEHALRARLVKEVAVSTDCEHIAEVARRCGARVVERPAELAADQSPSEGALLHAIEHIERVDGRAIDVVVFLQATSPIRGAHDIDGAIQRMLEFGADSCFSACPEHFTGRWRLGSNGMAEPVNFELTKRPRRQDYPLEYLENGSIYIFVPRVLRETGARLGGKIVIYPMTALNSIQIDSVEDQALAEDVIEIRRHVKLKQPDTSRLAAVEFLVLDFDGVMTDDRVLVDENGREMVACHRGDGWGLARLREVGVEIVVLSTETNPVVSARCKKLGIPCKQGSDDKLAELEEFARQRSLTPAHVAYMGNDVNDLECMRWAGVAIAPADAQPEIAALADILTPQCGGTGAVRQVADWILASRKNHTSPLERT